MSFFVLNSFFFFNLKSLLFDISIATPAFFWLLFAWTISSIHFVSIYVFGPKDLSWRQDGVGLCVFIDSDNLCPLKGHFNPFIFKVFTDRDLLLPFCCLYTLCKFLFLFLFLVSQFQHSSLLLCLVDFFFKCNIKILPHFLLYVFYSYFLCGYHGIIPSIL